MAKLFGCTALLLLAFMVILVNATTIKEHVPGLAAGTSAAQATPTRAIIIPESNAPPRTVSGSYTSEADSATAFAVASRGSAVTPTPAPTERPCVLTTWQDGSQSCDDGRVISSEQSKPGYCTPVQWANGSVSCNDGKKAGKVVWRDPELADEPTLTPWPAAPSDGVQWSAADGPNNNTCVTVGTQTACSDPGVKLNDNTAAFVARMIEDGKIKQGNGTPKG